VIPILMALVLAAPVQPELKRARDRFEFGAWADCAAIVRQYLAAHAEPPEAEAVAAFQMLGIAEWNLGDKAQSRAAFVSLLSVDPDQKLDPFLVPPAIVEFFEDVRREHEPMLSPLRERRRMLKEQERLAEEARRKLFAEERVRSGPATKIIRVQERSYILNWMPLGAGQFQNGHRAKGTAIAAAELILGAANLGAILVHSQLVDSSASRCLPSDPQCDRGYTRSARRSILVADVVKWSSAGLFWAAYGYGVYDAHKYYVPRVETEISPKEGAVTLSMRWEF
jgi:hypothetical protein